MRRRGCGRRQRCEGSIGWIWADATAAAAQMAQAPLMMQAGINRCLTSSPRNLRNLLHAQTRLLHPYHIKQCAIKVQVGVSYQSKYRAPEHDAEVPAADNQHSQLLKDNGCTSRDMRGLACTQECWHLHRSYASESTITAKEGRLQCRRAWPQVLAG